MFSPLHNLGLILIDEFHEQSYKQDSSPRYQTEIVAAKLASLTNSKLVIGSATPSITARFLADNNKLEHVVLKERALNSVHPKIQLVKISLGEIISKELKDKIDTALKNKKMSLIYINRRGTAPVYKCNDCGHSFECPNCGINLHFHADSMKLVCHVCDYKIQPPAKCPTCMGSNLRGVGVGTKAVLNELQDMFADAKIARIDTDSSKQKEFTETLDKINDGKVDIIVGTQMIGRGMDIANLELVGMINADYDLMSVDYNSLERAFQLLTQTAGRAGRRETQGEVIIQTSQPENPMLGLIIKNDFDSLYLQELKQRKKYSYPPYVYLLKLECGFVSPNLGKQKSLDLIKSLKGKPIAVLGPVKSHPAIKGKKHMWSLVIKSKNRNALQEIAKDLDQYWTVNLDPFGIS
jgi:primosomal protein N' (replication factor Y)